jgi:phenylpyruvate tautomerase PptA (4-oxalocrotonate tautomerase family)
MWSNTLTERRSKAGEEKSIIAGVAKVASRFMARDESALCLVGKVKSEHFSTMVTKVVKRRKGLLWA